MSLLRVWALKSHVKSQFLRRCLGTVSSPSEAKADWVPWLLAEELGFHIPPIKATLNSVFSHPLFQVGVG
jgi:hypothetical protein